jgi:hypothetical protein
MSNMPKTRDVRSLLAWLRKNQHVYIPGQRSPWSPAYADWNRDPDIEEELNFPNADTIEEALRLMDYPSPTIFRVNETEVPDTSNYILKWYEDASPTDISHAHLTAIDDSTRKVANKISKPECILDSGTNRLFFNSIVNLHDHNLRACNLLPCMSRRAGHFTRVWFSRQSLYI